jgi:hypothetical protein
MSIPSNYPNWQPQTGYPAYGVGDQLDLKVLLSTGEGGRWLAYIHPGYFYADNQEQYAYNDKGTVLSTVTGVTGSITEGVSFRPAWGPVKVFEGTTEYTEHFNCYQPGVTATWASVSGNVYVTTSPTGVFLHGVRDLSNNLLHREGSVDFLTERSYVHNENTGQVYVYSKTSPVQRFLDQIYYSPQLKIREIVRDEDGQVKLSYSSVKSLSLQRGYTSQSIATPGSGYIPHTLTADTGDWIVASYYVEDSFCVTDHNLLEVYTGSPGSTNLTVYFEKSLTEYPNLAFQTDAASGQPFQFNPTFSDSFRSGYLYHYATPVTGSAFRVELFPDRQVATKQFNEIIKVSGKVLDIEGLPLPKYPITLQHNLATANTLVVLPTPTGTTSSSFTTTTDNRGEVHWLIQTNGSIVGDAATFNLLTNTVSGTCTVSLTTSGSVINSNSYLRGGCSVVQSTEYSPRGYLKFLTTKHFSDGIPRIDSNTITIFSKTGSTFEYVDNEGDYAVGRRSIVVKPSYGYDNLFGVTGLTSELGVILGESDSILSVSASGQSYLTPFFDL